MDERRARRLHRASSASSSSGVKWRPAVGAADRAAHARIDGLIALEVGGRVRTGRCRAVRAYAHLIHDAVVWAAVALSRASLCGGPKAPRATISPVQRVRQSCRRTPRARRPAASAPDAPAHPNAHRPLRSIRKTSTAPPLGTRRPSRPRREDLRVVDDEEVRWPEASGGALVMVGVA